MKQTHFYSHYYILDFPNHNTEHANEKFANEYCCEVFSGTGKEYIEWTEKRATELANEWGSEVTVYEEWEGCSKQFYFFRQQPTK